jgi:hypothetical protein
LSVIARKFGFAGDAMSDCATNHFIVRLAKPVLKLDQLLESHAHTPGLG